MTAQEHHTEHEAVGAYVLGVLDPADATRFEAHLAICDECGRQLDELAGLEPLLAELAAETPGVPQPPATLHAVPGQGRRSGRGGHARRGVDIETLTARPSARILNRMMGEAAAARRKRRIRSAFMLAAAVALIIGGPVAAVNLSSDSGKVSANPAAVDDAAVFSQMSQKVQATDPESKVHASIAMEPKTWGTNTILELSNIKGPLTCSLVAVSESGQEQTLMTWSVPKWGYGIKDSTNEVARKPLYAHGGTGWQMQDIAKFEIRTLDGKRLASLDA